MDVILSYIQSNWIEVVGSTLSLIYIYLSIKQRISLWLFGFLSAAFYVVVFLQNKLYADMSLQFYYLGISIYGWISWNKGKITTEKALNTTQTSKQLWVYLSFGAFLLYLIYYYILLNFTDSDIPKSDAVVGALSIIATWMLARKLLENWLVWILTDLLCAALYIYKELYLTAILFFIYTFMAIVGYFQWKRDVKK